MKFTIKQAREYRGLSQEELAKSLGVSRQTYIDYEKGKVYLRIDQAHNFSNIVDIPIDQIIFFDS